jgi:hypothetical protein
MDVMGCKSEIGESAAAPLTCPFPNMSLSPRRAKSLPARAMTGPAPCVLLEAPAGLDRGRSRSASLTLAATPPVGTRSTTRADSAAVHTSAIASSARQRLVRQALACGCCVTSFGALAPPITDPRAGATGKSVVPHFPCRLRCVRRAHTRDERQCLQWSRCRHATSCLWFLETLRATQTKAASLPPLHCRSLCGSRASSPCH